MNKRIRKKIAKRQAEEQTTAVNGSASEAPKGPPSLREAAKHVAQALEETAEALLEKVPIVGDAAARSLHKIATRA